MEIVKYQQILEWSNDLDGVFTIKDLEVAFAKCSRAGLYRAVNKLVDSSEFIRVKRGIYAHRAASLAAISNRIDPDSYISLGTVLAKNLVIGSVPDKKIQAVRVGDPKIFTCELGTIEYLSINPNLFFGFERKNNQNWATVEKAFIDVCYFYYKRKKFSFDPVADLNLDLVNLKKVKKDLNRYNQRFITFFQQRWLSDEY